MHDAPPEVDLPAPYRPLRQLGGGGVATVHEVLDPRTGERVALKLWRQPLTRHTAERFRREVELMQSLHHPHVVRALDMGMVPRPWVVMPLLTDSWHRRLRGEGPVPARRALTVARDVLEGLTALHALGVVHRDLKPSNLLLDAAGRTVVADLGIVRAHDSELTRTDAMVGSPLYMAPEQRRDPRSVGPRADLYGLGACLWALTVGRNPPDLSLLPLRPSLADKLPEPVREVVLGAVHRLPDDRFSSAWAMAEAVSAALSVAGGT